MVYKYLCFFSVWFLDCFVVEVARSATRDHLSLKELGLSTLTLLTSGAFRFIARPGLQAPSPRVGLGTVGFRARSPHGRPWGSFGALLGPGTAKRLHLGLILGPFSDVFQEKAVLVEFDTPLVRNPTF